MSSKQDPVQPTYLEFEGEVAKIVCAMATCNTQIVREMIAVLRDRFTLEELAGVVLVSLEQLIRLDANAFVWAVERLIPTDVLSEIRRLTTIHVGKCLVAQGFIPGQDFSVDAIGKLLLSDRARVALAGF